MENLDTDVGFELLKLLVQLAWSDFSMSPEEATFLLNLTEKLCPGEEQQGAVLDWINGDTPLAAPNLGILRAHADDVMKAMAQLSLADGKIVEDEKEMLSQVAAMLSK